MKKKFKLLFGSMCTLGVICFGIILFSSKKDIPTYAIKADYVIDVDNPREVIGEADYVFVAQVKSNDGTEYQDRVPIENKNGKIEYVGDAYTNYSVHVIKNIKNELILDSNVKIQKMGGLREDGSAYDVFESDKLPEVDKYYIFIANTQEDGTLLISGANSNIELNDIKSNGLSKVRSNINKNSMYIKYCKYAKEEKKSDEFIRCNKYDKK